MNAQPVSKDPPAPIGLVAGGGSFPLLVARAARRRGREVVCLGIRGEVSPELAGEVDVFRVSGLGRLGACFRYFRRHRVRQISWAGWIRKETLFSPWRWLIHLPDLRAVRFWFRRLRDRQSQTLLSSVASEFEEEGFEIAHSARYCPELLVEEGLLTPRSPGPRHWEDIRFGWEIARRMADLDVGQSVVVLEKATVAVEGMEGTDRNILRAGELCPRGGFTVIKLARRDHDMRFDVPTVGPRTIEILRQARAAVLAIEAERTLVLEREEVVRLARKHKIVVVALSDPPFPPDWA